MMKYLRNEVREVGCEDKRTVWGRELIVRRTVDGERQ